MSVSCLILLCLVTCIRGQSFTDNPDSVPSDEVFRLESLNVYPHENKFRYQARCSVPCLGSYPPGSLYITVILDRTTQNLQAFGNFEASQSADSSIWWLLNSNWVTQSNTGQCIFDIQIDYAPVRYPEPSGTCQLGWNITTECPVPEDPGSIEGYTDCTALVEDNPSLCYNHSIYNRCCHSCSTRAMISSMYDTYCPYGDRDISSCNDIGQHECYSSDFTCCATCLTYMESISGCPYGNRDPFICDYILHSDCYNSTTARTCCHECHLLADSRYPDCQYGDKAPFCFSMERNECYRNSVENTCCQTCRLLYSDNVEDCEYGDRRDCYDVTIDECQTDKSLRQQCCETCHYLKENDCYGDQTSCFTIASQECYDVDVRRDCCKTCLIYYDVTFGDDCPFGDRSPDCWFNTDPHHCYIDQHRHECCETCKNCTFGDRLPLACVNISGPMCYNSNVAYDCCVQCSFFELQHLPGTCLYGNKRDSCCDILSLECYKPSIEDQCCETCHSYNRTDSQGYDCRYGDKIDSCYNRPVNSCYNDNARDTCCQFCAVMENRDDPECPYGDKLPLCTSTLTPAMCYNFEDECCRACDVMVKQHLGSSCKYGDRINCSGLEPSSCYISSILSDCCETCYNLQSAVNTSCDFGDSADCSTLAPWQCYSREQECCESCVQYLRSEPVTATCKYGDKSGNCVNINPYECYRLDTEDSCCETCAGNYRNDLPEGCAYGDRSTICLSGHSSYCYNSTIRRVCCESCYYAQTDIDGCLFGDRATFCDDIDPHNCYNPNTEVTCCQTCSDYYQPDYPSGCKYGDTFPSCRESECSNYNENELQGCCYTCRSYQTSTPITTTTEAPSSERSTSSIPEVNQSTSTISSLDTSSSRDTSPSRGTRSTREKNYPSPTTLTNVLSSPVASPEKRATANMFFDNLGAILGGVIGGVVFIVLLVIVVCYCMKVRNKHRHNDYKQPASNGLDGRQDNQVAMIPSGAGLSGSTGVRYDRTRYNHQTVGPAPSRQDSGEEVYDYINPDDVKTVISMPITRRPTLPERNEPTNNEPYLEPQDNELSEKTGYDNLAIHKDPAVYHQYYVLQKEPDNRL